MITIVDFARQFVGKQETEAPNQGPLIRRWRREVLGGGDTGAVIPWCGISAFALYMEFTGLSRPKLIDALGFSRRFFPESADSWATEGQRAGKITRSPKMGDIFVWMKRTSPTSYSTTDGHHVGIHRRDEAVLHAGVQFPTMEGNTTPGVTSGIKSREGDGFYFRSRVWYPGAFLTISVAESLKVKP
jgi:hypothetical protein